MKNFWRKIQRQFFSYQKSDRNALIILGLILLFVVLINTILPFLFTPSANDFSEIETLIKEWEESKKEEAELNPKLSLFLFNPNQISEEKLDSLDLPFFVKRNLLRYREAGGYFKTADDVRKIYGMNDSIFKQVENYLVLQSSKITETKVPLESKSEIERKVFQGKINPNIASYDSLIEFGFSAFQASNIIAYREKGGNFIKPEDLLKIYGVDSVMFSQIKEHLETTNESKLSNREVNLLRIELNNADTTILKTLPGIGSVYAARIVKYRNLLGGFYSPRQLSEVYNFPEATLENIIDRLSVDTTNIKKLRINFLDYADLLRHPYLNKEQVNELIKHRETSGAFKNLKEVEGLETFENEYFQRVKPYLSCN